MRSHSSPSGPNDERPEPRSANAARSSSLSSELKTKVWLLELNLCASFFQLLLEVFCFVLGCAFLDGRRRFVNESLGFFEAETGDRAYQP